MIDEICGQRQCLFPLSQLGDESSGGGVAHLSGEEHEIEVVLLLQLGDLGEDALEQSVWVAGEQHLRLPLLILHIYYKPIMAL